MNYKTEQEKFWNGEFGDEYISRNESLEYLSSNVRLFSRIIEKTTDVKSVIELGCNIGSNLEAIKIIKNNIELSAIEINKEAANIVKSKKIAKVYNESILNFDIDYKRDFVFTKGVLIHINPEELKLVYDLMYNMSNKYICMVEYYSPNPVNIEYRGHSDKLFKRDFAGEFMGKFKDVELIDYGFIYRNDNNFKQDDATWFLMKKK